MARFREMITSFLGGEVSPKVWGRTDLDGYKNTCEELLNFIPTVQGGALRRAGTVYVSGGSSHFLGNPIDADETEIDVANTTTDLEQRYSYRMFPFVTSNNRRFLVALREGNATSVVKIYETVDDIFLGPIFNEYAPSNVGSQSGRYSLFDHGYMSRDDLLSVQTAVYGNAMFFAFGTGTMAPFALDFNPATGNFFLREFWRFKQLGVPINATYPTITEFASSVPFAARNVGSTTMSINTTTVGTGRTLTASAATFVAPTTRNDPPPGRGTGGVTLPNSVGTLIRVTGDSSVTTGVAVITGVTSSTVATVQVLVAFEDTSPSSNWAMQAYSDVAGWPKSVTIFENRLYYGGTVYDPNRFWASRVGALWDMRQEKLVQDTPYPGVTNADPFDFAIASERVANIRWMTSGKTLLIGTDNREYVAYGPDGTQAMGPLNVNVSTESAYGSAALQPTRIGSAILFVPRSRRMLREFVYNFQEDSYKADNIMRLAEHLPKKLAEEYNIDELPQLQGIAHQEYDHSVTWCWDRTGGLFSVTRDREAGVSAFARHQLAGKLYDHTNANPDGGTVVVSEIRPSVVTACVLPNPDGDYDDLYLLVRRNINGENVNFLERMERPFERNEIFIRAGDADSRYYPVSMDAAAIIQNGPFKTNEFEDLFPHLANQVVDVIGDGSYLGQFTMGATGTLNLGATEVYTVVVGLSFRSWIKTSNLNAGSVLGSSQNAFKTIDDFAIRFSRTIGGKYGLDLDDLFDIEFRPADLDMNDPIPLFTGDKQVTFPAGWESKLNIHIVQDLPFPMCVDAIMMRGLAND